MSFKMPALPRSRSMILFWVYVLGLLPVSIFDRDLTVFLAQHDVPLFSHFMDRSIFNGNIIGCSDIFSLLLIACVLMYVGWEFLPSTASRIKSKFIPFTVAELGYVTATVILLAFTVHVVKYVTGRARPYLVLRDNPAYHFTPWWLFGEHIPIKDGFYTGSMPSGHVSTIMTMFTLVVILKRKDARSTSLVTVILLAAFIAMATARSMSGHHWVSDSYIGFGLGMGVVQYTNSRIPWHKTSSRHLLQELRTISYPMLILLIVGIVISFMRNYL